MSLKDGVQIAALILFLSSPARAAELSPLSKSMKLLGLPLEVKVQGKADDANYHAENRVTSKFLGHNSSLIENSVTATNVATPDASPAASPSVPLGSTDFYLAGVRVWTGKLRYEKGSLIYSGGVAPVQIPFPIFVYPIGPLDVELDAGLDLEGDLSAAITPGPSYPLSDSTIGLKVSANLMAAGYLEGYASIWLIRAGVGGRLTMIDGSTGINEFFYLNGTPPMGSYLGGFTLMKGDIYGFADVKFFFGRWNRIFKHDFFKWPGKCFSFGGSPCGLQ